MIPFGARDPIIHLSERNRADPRTRAREVIEVAKDVMQRLLDIEVTEYGTIIEEIELICAMTGFRRRFLVHHLGEGFFRSVELF